MNSPHLQRVDYLIVGQGLAGSLLAWELSNKGCRVIVVDNGAINASQIAAGLINPITGMRLVKNSDIDFLLPAAKKFYQSLTLLFKKQFLVEKPMLRILRNQQEKQYGKKRMADPDYQPYLSELDFKIDGINLSATTGILQQKQTGYLQTQLLLAEIKQYLRQSDRYIKTKFDYQELKIQTNHIQWRNIKTSKIIFCEGYLGMNNPWFSWLPFNPVKGEILTLACQHPFTDYLLNYGFWLLPSENNTLRTGATYDREQIDTQATTQAKNSLLQALTRYVPAISANPHVTNHQAQIRPATLDKHPFLGCHPKHPKLCIFNGFGSKGSLQIPWYVTHFAEYLINSAPLPKRANIDRYHEKYFSVSQNF